MELSVGYFLFAKKKLLCLPLFSLQNRREMSIYQKLSKIRPDFIPKGKLFKFAFNHSPMYRRTTAKVLNISEDLLEAKIKLPLSWKNRNYVGSIFGGSLYSAVDPIYMIQLINILGEEYVVWDKAATIKFRKPARENLYADFIFTKDEIEEIKARVKKEKEIDVIKNVYLMDKTGSKVYCEVEKTLYVAEKEYYKNKRKRNQKD
jgi:acyl-coenzyme A thioesterase PaaI-like protein